MANPEHVDLIRSGTTVVRDRLMSAWHKARQCEQVLQLDLAGADLNGLDLSGAYLPFANFENASLINVNFTGANLVQANFDNAKLARARFDKCELENASFCGAKLSDASLSYANLRHAKFETAELRSAFFLLANMTGADFRWADLSKALLLNVTMNGGVILGIETNDAYTLPGGDLSGAILIDSDLRGSVFRQVLVDGTNFSGAISSATSFLELDFSDSIGLASMVHIGPSTIDFQTIKLSKGSIPRSFLRGCGLSDNAVNFALNALDPVPESCFISYSQGDDRFVHKIYEDLQERGVRCWFAPNDMRPGDRFRVAIDEAIQMHDRVLLVVSQASIKSQWVEHEVETALARERAEERIILIPVGIDDQAFTAAIGWPSFLKNTRHIADFRGWNDKSHYMVAFERVVKALRISHPH